MQASTAPELFTATPPLPTANLTEDGTKLVLNNECLSTTFLQDAHY